MASAGRLIDRAFFRVWLILGSIYLLSMGFTSYFLLGGLRTEAIQKTSSQINHSTDLAWLQLNSDLKKIEKDIQVLANSPEVRDFATNLGNAEPLPSTDRLSALFKAYLKVYPEYFQIRVLDADSGDELVRVEKKAGRLVQTPMDSLQNKANRDYFTATRSLKPGQFYLSNLDLNQERGKVVVPYTKTIRIGAPLTRGFGENAAILIINVDAGLWLTGLQRYEPDFGRMYLLDDKGGFLIHPDDQLSFLPYKASSDALLSDPDKELLKEFGKDRLELIPMKDHDLYFIASSTTLREDYAHPFTMVTTVEKELLFEGIDQKIQNTLIILVTALLAGLILLFLASKWLTGPLSKIAERVRAFSPGQPVPQFSRASSSELDALQDSFTAVANKVNHQIEELENAREKAEEASTEKERFLSNFSHELRTPLNSLSGMTEVLNKNKKLPSQEPVIQTIQASVDHLKAMIGDVLDYGRILENQVQLNEGPVLLEEWLKNTLMGHQLAAKRKQINLSYNLDPGLPAYIQTDKLRLTQILHNLLSNAIKFTRKGSITVELKADDNSNFHLIVTDSGEGIPEKDQALIFHRYQQTDAGKSAKEGLGLGLAIVKHLVELFEGEIDLQSDPGVGSKFKITLPLHPLEVDNTASPKPENKLPALDLLYIDDVEVNRNTLRYLLQDSPIQLTTSSGCEECMEDHDISKFDAILMDLRMPEVDGFECIQRIHQRHPSIPIIPLSANLGKSELDQLSDLGIFSALEKPIDLNQLILALNHIKSNDKGPIKDHVLEQYCNGNPDLLQKISSDVLAEIERALEDLGPETSHIQIAAIHHKLSPSFKMFEQEHLISQNHSAGELKMGLEQMRSFLQRLD